MGVVGTRASLVKIFRNHHWSGVFDNRHHNRQYKRFGHTHVLLRKNNKNCTITEFLRMYPKMSFMFAFLKVCLLCVYAFGGLPV